MSYRSIRAAFAEDVYFCLALALPRPCRPFWFPIILMELSRLAIDLTWRLKTGVEYVSGFCFNVHVFLI